MTKKLNVYLSIAFSAIIIACSAFPAVSDCYESDVQDLVCISYS